MFLWVQVSCHLVEAVVKSLGRRHQDAWCWTSGISIICTGMLIFIFCFCCTSLANYCFFLFTVRGEIWKEDIGKPGIWMSGINFIHTGRLLFGCTITLTNCFWWGCSCGGEGSFTQVGWLLFLWWLWPFFHVQVPCHLGVVVVFYAPYCLPLMMVVKWRILLPSSFFCHSTMTRLLWQ